MLRLLLSVLVFFVTLQFASAGLRSRRCKTNPTCLCEEPPVVVIVTTQPPTTTTTKAPTTTTTKAPTTTTTKAPTTTTTKVPTTTTTTCPVTTTTRAPTTTTTTCPVTTTTKAPTTTTTTCPVTTTKAPTTTTTTCPVTTTKAPTTTTTICPVTTTTKAPTTTTTTCPVTTAPKTIQPPLLTTTACPIATTTTRAPTTKTTVVPPKSTGCCKPFSVPVKPATTPLVIAPVETTVAPKPVVIEKFSCFGKKSGTYGFGCSCKFAVCDHGYLVYLSCPAGLVYDEEVGVCMDKKYVKACGGVPTPTTAAPLPMHTHLTPPPMHITEASPPIAVTLKPHPVFDCRRMNDGLYGVGCSRIFYLCKSGVTSPLMCPKGLVYDVISGQCLEKEFVKACGGYILTPQRPVLAPPKNCLGFAGVASYCHKYTICLGNQMKQFHCPRHQCFDVKLHKCVSQRYGCRC